MTVHDFLAAGTRLLTRARIPEPRREAESILAHAIGKDAIWIIAHPETMISKSRGRAILKSIGRRAKREPFAYVVGEKWFHGRSFRITKDVLIPRPETEILVESILSLLSSRAKRSAVEGSVALDLGTGSGAIGLTLAAEIPGLHVIACDISDGALRVARRNARRLKLARRTSFKKIDILKNGSLDFARDDKRMVIVAANLPYLPTAVWKKAAPEVRLHEPKLALVSGKDGLDHYRALFRSLARWKRPPAVLAVEAEPEQFAELRRLARTLMPAARIDVIKDLHGDDRVLVAAE